MPELDKLKQEEIKLLLGRRQIRSKAMIMMRARHGTKTTVHIEMRWVRPSFMAHGYLDNEQDKLTDIIKAHGLTRAVLAHVLNKVLKVKPREPFRMLAKELRACAKNSEQPRLKPWTGCLLPALLAPADSRR